jgi:hypothetical protein
MVAEMSSVATDPEDAAVRREALAFREDVIEQGLRTFIEVGRALEEIRDWRLYREAGFTSFEDYCRRRWCFSRQRAYQFIEATHIVYELAAASTGANGAPIPDPTNEAQVRELGRIKDPRQRRVVWEWLQDKRGGVVTAADIRGARLAVARDMARANAPIETAEGQRRREIRKSFEAVRICLVVGLLNLDPAEVVSALEADEMPTVRDLLGRCRVWVDEFDLAIASAGSA